MADTYKKVRMQEKIAKRYNDNEERNLNEMIQNYVSRNYLSTRHLSSDMSSMPKNRKLLNINSRLGTVEQYHPGTTKHSPEKVEEMTEQKEF